MFTEHSKILNLEVCVVDDDPDICEELSEIIRSKGYRVSVSGSSEDALTKIKENPSIKLVITDLSLPGANGFELLEKLTKINPEIRSVVITGREDLSAAQRAIRLGADDFLTKPLSADEFSTNFDRIAAKIMAQGTISSSNAHVRSKFHVKSIDDLRVDFAEISKSYEHLTQSIDYALRIQRATLPHEDAFRLLFSDYFVIWQPRDGVGGDIFWNHIWGDGVLVGLADCTGHGVPGAFMTLLASAALERALDEVPVGDLAKLVQRFHQRLQLSLKQNEVSKDGPDDGLDLAIVYIDANMESARFCGAGSTMFHVNNKFNEEFKGSKLGIGYRRTEYLQEFPEIEFPLVLGDRIYMFTDGVTDQVGGDKRLMFGKKRFKKLLADVQPLTMIDQAGAILEHIDNYANREPRRDDLSLIGFSI